jgi:PknH-like extracellular domain
MLRDRSDVTYRTRTEIDNLLASVDAKSAAPPAPSRSQHEHPVARTAPSAPPSAPADPPKRVMQRRTQAVPNGRVCQRVLSAMSRVVIDVVACGTNITDEADQVAEHMAAEVTR